jgi:cysteine synthase A
MDHGALAAIGSTPVVRLCRLADASSAEVWVKLEAANPTGSYKDRMALAMIEGAERSRRIAVEPAESAVLSGRPAGTHRIEGGGVGFRPDLLDVSDVDEVIAVSTDDAIAMARRAAREQGIFSGPSTGANLLAALEVARRLGPGHRVVTIQVDSGLKYLSGPIFAPT